LDIVTHFSVNWHVPPSHHMHTVIYTSIPEGGVNVNTSALVEEGYYAAPKPMGKVTMADQCNSYESPMKLFVHMYLAI